MLTGPGGSGPTTPEDDCPPFDDAKRVVCYGAVDTEAEPIVLVPERQSVQPEQPTEFTLRNRSQQQFNTNFYAWRLHKRVDGDWYHVAPRGWPEPLTPLDRGEQHTWTLTVTTDRVSDGAPVEIVQATEELTVAGLGSGHYAFGIEGWFQSRGREKSIALAAGFELHADPLQLTPTAAIAETGWDGQTLVAGSTRGELVTDADQPDAFILERLDGSGSDGEQRIVEQVVRDEHLRDTIALSQRHDADRVRLEEFSRSTPAFGLRDARTVAFQGNRYRVTAERGDRS